MSKPNIVGEPYVTNDRAQVAIGRVTMRDDRAEIPVYHLDCFGEWKSTVAVFYGRDKDEALLRALACLEVVGALFDRAEAVLCQRCEKVIRGRATYLELNCRTLEWTDPKVTEVPMEDSQGCFPFGPKCVKPALEGKPYKGPRRP